MHWLNSFINQAIFIHLWNRDFEGQAELEVRKYIPGQNKKFCMEPGRLSKAYLLPTLLRNLRYPLQSFR